MEPSGSLEDSLKSEIDLILREHRNQSGMDRERDLNIYRSGSAPPTVEGSLSAVGSLLGNSDFRDFNTTSVRGFNSGGLSEEEIRSHPTYLSYYYSHDNINPRLPPPSLSREDWRVAQRFQAGGSSLGEIGDWRKKKAVEDGESSSLFSMQPGLSVKQAEDDLMKLRNASGRNLSRQTLSAWTDRGSNSSVGLSSSGLGARRKSFADILQEGLDRPASMPSFLSCPSSCNAFGDGVQLTEGLHNGLGPYGPAGVQSHGTAAPYSFSSAPGSSLSRSTTPEPKLVGRSPSSGLPPVGSRISPVEQKNVRGLNVQNGHSSGMNELADIAANLSGLSLSEVRNRDVNGHVQSQLHLDQNLQPELLDAYVENLSLPGNYVDLARKNGIGAKLNASEMSSNSQVNFPKRTSSANLYGSSGFGSLEGSNAYIQNATASGIDFMPGAFPVNQKRNSAIDNHFDAALTSTQNGQNMSSLGNNLASDLHSPITDPRYCQFFQRTSDYAARTPTTLNDPSLLKSQYATSNGELEGLQKAYLEALLAQQRERLELSLLSKSGGLSYDNYSIGPTGSYGLGTAYLGNTMGNLILPTVGSGSPMFQNERILRFNSMMRNSMGRSVGSWNSDIGNNLDGRIVSSLLDEFKNNKTKSFELSDIVDHVVDFSTDQYGSRFIQQKLETATAEEKSMIFPEIIPHARTLMTDVFGNYVIQKFFEHGTESQRKELANQLSGHVLPLSLQMYGCRVIQKALEVVDVDQQTQMVAELDGSVMKCVRDQNGNHVVQKSIECVPQDRIQFIISAFYGHVFTLSTHPYGCRVIQRVLEHCDNPETQQIIMDEIMQSVCTLAQDQYGNYVIQHVLEHGKPHERSAIICQLAGQIVRMSQQKFASNVVEKCLTFGSPEERQILVDEMLGSTEENEPLQAMMKDPFGNYVVQKVLETCNDESLELLLSRIKVHLNTLKRYTYGKHIVSRVEKLIATGERRISLASSAISS